MFRIIQCPSLFYGLINLAQMTQLTSRLGLLYQRAQKFGLARLVESRSKRFTRLQLIFQLHEGKQHGQKSSIYKTYLGAIDFKLLIKNIKSKIKTVRQRSCATSLSNTLASCDLFNSSLASKYIYLCYYVCVTTYHHMLARRLSVFASCFVVVVFFWGQV